jgi:hypothetical protein
MKTGLVGLAIAGLFMAGVSEAAEADAAGSEWQACKAEDGSGQRRCVWDGRHMGNGEGKSLIIRHGGTDDMTITVIRHKRAHRLLGL